MSEDPTISVVIPTYYRNEYLRNTIESVQDQKISDVEIIVVDGSENGHAKSVTESLGEITYVPQEKDRGPHAARSIGFGYSSGEYIQFLDDDDELLAGKFSRQLELFEAEDRIDVVYCGTVHEGGKVVDPNPEIRGDVLVPALKFKMPPCIPSTMLIRRSAVERIHPFDNFHAADDAGMKIELARSSKFDFISESLVRKGDPPQPYSSSIEHVTDKFYLLDRYRNTYEKNIDISEYNAIKSMLYKQLAERHLSRSIWSRQAVQAYYESLCYSPSPSIRNYIEFLSYLGGRPTHTLIKSGWRKARGLF
ncbi:MAG: glycosyltransferase family 2 protein [Halobacteriaceae archaeon]